MKTRSITLEFDESNYALIEEYAKVFHFETINECARYLIITSAHLELYCFEEYGDISLPEGDEFDYDDEIPF